jgi:transglutaminase-like putative cysteine protease
MDFRLIRPLPRGFTRLVSAAVLLAWFATMAAVVHRAQAHSPAANLAADLARYGSAAQWRGVYYRGDKVGFTVSQTVPVDDGFEIQEDGRLELTLLGAASTAAIRTTARVDQDFALRSFEFSLDPGTGATRVIGDVDGAALNLTIATAAGERTHRIELDEPPVLAANLGRRLALAGLAPGRQHRWQVFDPATLASAPLTATVGPRENVTLDVHRERVTASGRQITTIGGRPIPAFRVELSFAGVTTTSWVTDTGEVVREESPMGLITVRETAEQAQQRAVGTRGRTDLIDAAAVRPVMRGRIDDPRNVERLLMRVEGADLSSPDVQGAGQQVTADIVELRDPRTLVAARGDTDLRRFLAPEPFIESDDPEIVAEAERALAGAGPSARERAERLTRYVNALLEKKPTVSLPSASEVLRTRVGDCNEHTVLYVAMARAAGLPARIATGLTFVRGAFYYHAWPEVYIDEGQGGGYWLPVDPTLNQFPADATHLRLARGGLESQAAILPLIGRLKITVLELDLTPGSVPVLVGRARDDVTPLSIALPAGNPRNCWAPRPR